MIRKIISPLPLLFIFLSVVAYILAINAYVIDDAYITFRTIDNFLNGHGLRWNIDERVQVYTHPLWMMLLSFVIWFTGEFHVTTMAVSLAVTISTLFIVSRTLSDNFCRDLWKVYLFLCLFLASKAALDYASSGLENPLTNLLLALFFIVFIAENKNRTIFGAAIIASLLAVNRYDTVLIVLPALAYLSFYKGFYRSGQVLQLLLCFLPIISWVLFSLLYYGFIFPNTAYAKLINNDLDFLEKFSTGLIYLFHNIVWDLISYILLIIGTRISIKENNQRHLMLYIGIYMYILYVVFHAASATHMSGRFFASIHFLNLILFISQIAWHHKIRYIFIWCLLFLIAYPGSSIWYGTAKYSANQLYNSSRIDIKTGIHIYETSPHLSNWRINATEPGNVWMATGKEFKLSPEKVHVSRSEAIGYVGFFAGPEKFIIDKVALSDPLLARIPPYKSKKSGHYHRKIPAGYIESVDNQTNMISDPSLKAFYEKIRIITRNEQLLSPARLKTIVLMNIGYYDDLIERYMRNH